MTTELIDLIRAGDYPAALEAISDLQQQCTADQDIETHLAAIRALSQVASYLVGKLQRAEQTAALTNEERLNRAVFPEGAEGDER